MPLIVIEGIDGSGKSSLAEALADSLGGHLYVFPSHTGAVGKLIRETFAGQAQVHPLAMQHLFIADALDFDSEVAARVSRGETVIMDRHPTVSGWVYQSERVPIDLVLQICLTNCFTPPDLTVILDVPAKVAVERLRARGRHTRTNAANEDASLDVIDGRRSRYMAYNVMHPKCHLLDGQKPVIDGVGYVQSRLGELRAQEAAQT